MPKQHLPAALALAEGGIVTRAALVAAGLDDDLGNRLHRERRGLRLAPSTYLLTSTAPTQEQLIASALEHAGPDCLITGLVACRELELPDVAAGSAVEALVPAGRRRVSTDHVVVRPTTRHPGYWVRDGIRFAEPHRAVVDACRGLTSLRDARALVTGAVCRQLRTPAELLAELDGGRRNGSALPRRAIVDALNGARSARRPKLPTSPRALHVLDDCHRSCSTPRCCSAGR
jgi:hypothetical protein